MQGRGVSDIIKHLRACASMSVYSMPELLSFAEPRLRSLAKRYVHDIFERAKTKNNDVDLCNQRLGYSYLRRSYRVLGAGVLTIGHATSIETPQIITTVHCSVNLKQLWLFVWQQTWELLWPVGWGQHIERDQCLLANIESGNFCVCWSFNNPLGRQSADKNNSHETLLFRPPSGITSRCLQIVWESRISHNIKE